MEVDVRATNFAKLDLQHRGVRLEFRLWYFTEFNLRSRRRYDCNTYRGHRIARPSEFLPFRAVAPFEMPRIDIRLIAKAGEGHELQPPGECWAKRKFETFLRSNGCQSVQILHV